MSVYRIYYSCHIFTKISQYITVNAIYLSCLIRMITYNTKSNVFKLISD